MPGVIHTAPFSNRPLYHRSDKTRQAYRKKQVWHSGSSISSTHVSKQHPEWILTYGDTKYLDPGNKDVQIYVNNVIRDYLARYDVDAIHFDDYFYPYRIGGVEFPDNASYENMDREWTGTHGDEVMWILLS